MRVVVVRTGVGEEVFEDAAGRPGRGYNSEPGVYGTGFKGRVREVVGAGSRYSFGSTWSRE